MDENTDLTPSLNDIGSTDDAVSAVEATLDRFLYTASVDAVYGEPVEHGDTMIIPSAEVLAFMGFGVGYGSGPANAKGENGQETQGTAGGGGGGGGGRTFSRPVAVVIASPEGVRVEPVVDVTKISLAFFTMFGFIFAMVARMSRRRPPRFNRAGF